jgi:hypothetical protein
MKRAAVWALRVGLGLLLLASSSLARAADVDPEGAVPDDEFSGSLLKRSHTIAILEAGIIALPRAPLSPSQRGGDTPLGAIGRGDATLQTGLHLLYRGGSRWAVGAGAFFGPQPTSDDQYGGLGGLPRTHSRSYLFLGGEARYFPLTFRWVEVWFGAAGGGIVIADRFVTNVGDERPQILGRKEVTVRTEGLAIGAQLGLDWMFADRWVAGLAARADRWFLPNTPRCTAIFDCATLTGIVEAIEVGLTIGYRIPL